MRRLLTFLAPVLALTAACAGIGTNSAVTLSNRAAAAGPDLGIRHVFVIVLENESSASTYLHNPHPYLGKVLQRQGTLLTNYYATGHVSLDNYVSMISGQAPNLVTS